MDLNQKLSAYRDEEMEKRSRAADLADEQAKRELNSDEIAELDEIHGRIKTLQEQQRSIQSQLEIGPYSKDVNEPIGMNDKEIREFSLLKLLKAQSRDASQADRDAATLELEASRAVEQKIGQAATGCYIPTEITGDYRSVNDPVEKRDLSADVFSQAGALVGVDFRPQQLIPLLRNAMALSTAGVTMLDGLVGDVAIPRQTGAGSTTWVNTDGGAVSETNQTVGQVTLTPRTLGAFTDYTRQLRLQSSVSVENFIRQDLMTIVALEKDRAALHGSGTAGQPVGIANTTGVGTETFSTTGGPTRPEVIAMRSDLATANALAGNLNFITNSTVYGNLLSELVDAGSGQFLLNENTSTMIGRNVIESNQVAANTIFFGNWADLLMGSWGGMDILIDPYTASTTGTVRVVIFHTCDVAVRRPASFTVGS